MSIQGSQEWFAERCGKATASRISDIIAKTKSGPSASRQNYLAQLVAERLTGKPAESYSNAAMQWGTETEPFARASYELATGFSVDEVGFIPHPTIEMSGASPDGLVGDVRLVEIKCPNTATHIEYLISREVPEKYKPQMAWQLLCTGRKSCDFVSFDPRMPDYLQLLIVEYVPDAEYLKFIEDSVKEFLVEVENKVSVLLAMYKTSSFDEDYIA